MSVKEKIKNIENKLTENTITKVKDKDKVKEYNARYYAKNRTKITTQAHQKVNCPVCGKQITRYRLNLHKTTSLCKRTLENKLKDEKIINDIKNKILYII